MTNIYPNLFIPGAAKSGTSSLHSYLAQHPDIYMCSIKEPHYFSAGNAMVNKESDYLKLFSRGLNKKYRGESSTGYMVFPGVIDKIKAHCPNPHFIFILRNPIDRAYSHYNWLRGLGVESREFLDAFYFDFNSLPDPKQRAKGTGYKNYFQWGRYAYWIEPFISAFGKDKIYVTTTEELAKDALRTVNMCVAFLNLPELVSLETRNDNQSGTIKYLRTSNFLWAVHRSIRIAARPIIASAPTYLKNLYNKIGPIAMRERILSQRVPQQAPALAASHRDILANHYRDDVNRLKIMTGKSFEHWSDFI